MSETEKSLYQIPKLIDLRNKGALGIACNPTGGSAEGNCEQGSTATGDLGDCLSGGTADIFCEDGTTPSGPACSSGSGNSDVGCNSGGGGALPSCTAGGDN